MVKNQDMLTVPEQGSITSKQLRFVANLIPASISEFLQTEAYQEVSKGYDKYSPLEVLEGYSQSSYMMDTPDKVLAMIDENEKIIQNGGV